MRHRPGRQDDFFKGHWVSQGANKKPHVVRGSERLTTRLSEWVFTDLAFSAYSVQPYFSAVALPQNTRYMNTV